MKKEFIKILKVIILGAIITSGIGFSVASWNPAPGDDPSSGNAAAPVNVGTTDQSKDGGLVVGDDNTSHLAIGPYKFFSAGNTAVSNDLWNSGNFYVTKYVGVGERDVCVDKLGTLKVCDIPPVPPEICIDTNASNQGDPLPCICESGYSLNNTQDGCVAIPPDCQINQFYSNKNPWTYKKGEVDYITYYTRYCDVTTLKMNGVDLPDSDWGMWKSPPLTKSTSFTLTASYPPTSATENIRLIGQQVYKVGTSSGDCTNCTATAFYVPSGTTEVTVEAWGGGAGGGGGGMSEYASNADSSGGGGGGGASGGYLKTNYTVPGNGVVLSVSVGTGGAGGTGTNSNDSNSNSKPGSAGNSSYVKNGNTTVISAPGGNGGARGPNSASGGEGAGGAAVTGGVAGGSASAGNGGEGAGGADGGNYPGSCGNMGNPGFPGTFRGAMPGAGGGGGSGGNSQCYLNGDHSGASGGAGGPGQIVITWYY